MTDAIETNPVYTVEAAPPAHMRDQHLEARDLALSEQRCRHAVAPHCKVRTNRGVLVAGDEIHPEDVGGHGPLSRLAHRGVVLSLDDHVYRSRCVEDAHSHVVIGARNRSTGRLAPLTCPGSSRIVVPGAGVSAADFHIDPRPGRMALNKDGVATQIGGHPGCDGKARLSELEQSGLIVKKSKFKPAMISEAS